MARWNPKKRVLDHEHLELRQPNIQDLGEPNELGIQLQIERRKPRERHREH